MADEFDFSDLKTAEKVLKYKGETYVVTEASTAAAVAYRNASLKCAKLSDGKVIGMDGAADLEPLLVNLCTFKTNPAGERTMENVPITTIRSWPARIIKPVFEWIKEVSELSDNETPDDLRKQIAKLQEKLDKLETNDPKGEPSDTTPTSG